MKSLLIKLLDRLLTGMAGTDAELYELNRLLFKAGRRCAYDLKHAAGHLWFLGEKLRRLGVEDDWRIEIYERYEQRSEMWLGVFNPGDDQKNYRDRLHDTIDSLETRVERYKELLEKHEIPDPFDDEQIPF